MSIISNIIEQPTVKLSCKVKLACEYTRVACKFLMSQLVRMPLLLASIIVKYMDIISTVLARNTTGNLIVTDGPYVYWDIE